MKRTINDLNKNHKKTVEKLKKKSKKSKETIDKFLEQFKKAEKEFSKLKKDNEKHTKDKKDFAKIIGKKNHKLLIGMSCSCKAPWPSFNYKRGSCMGTGHRKDYKNLDNYMKKWEKERKTYSTLPCIDGKFMDSKLYKEYKAKNKKK